VNTAHKHEANDLENDRKYFNYQKGNDPVRGKGDMHEFVIYQKQTSIHVKGNQFKCIGLRMLYKKYRKEYLRVHVRA